ncbi:MAG: xylulokinase [Caldilineaceae bacterium]|nr:xylulokinase [Caldilineaceae bacterium]
MYLIGIDSSTTATKSLIIDGEGEIVAVGAAEYPFETPQPLWSEQHPDLWWDGTVQSMRAALDQSGIDPAEVGAVGVSGQMHGLVLLDEEGVPLRQAILWNDQRTGKQCDDMRLWLGKENLVRITGNDALAGFTAPKILWVKENEPEIYSRVRQILLPKDYVRFKLTGDYATDKAGAGGTSLLELATRDWSPTVLAALEIPPQFLPPTHEGTQVTGTISAQAAEATGLRAGTPVVGGGGDQSAQGMGVGAIEEGIVALTLGTSGVVFATANEPFYEPEGRLHAFPHALPDKWHLMGVMLSAAGSLRWHRDTLAPGVEFDDLVAPASEVPIGSEGLLFLPYLTGERTPHPDPFARGAFVGLTVRHELAHMTRAVLEGVAFGLRDSFTLMQGVGLGEIRQVRVSGGGARSPLWRQILADVLGSELVTVNTTEGAAYGAALLAGVGAGVWPDGESACAATIRVTGSTTPKADAVAAYHEFYELYQGLYPALRATFDGVRQNED